eukprot:COSAG06_NODE_7374_length_2525_cov_1.829349_3_plen_116_part_00
MPAVASACVSSAGESEALASVPSKLAARRARLPCSRGRRTAGALRANSGGQLAQRRHGRRQQHRERQGSDIDSTRDLAVDVRPRRGEAESLRRTEMDEGQIAVAVVSQSIIRVQR